MYSSIALKQKNKNTEAKKMLQINDQTNFELDMSLDSECSRNYAFEQAFSEAVDSTFSMLGEKSKEVLFRFLEKRLRVEKCAIGKDPSAFEEAVEAVFGQASLIVEIQIIRALHDKIPNFKYKGVNTSFSFLEYVEELRRYV